MNVWVGGYIFVAVVLWVYLFEEWERPWPAIIMAATWPLWVVALIIAVGLKVLMEVFGE